MQQPLSPAPRDARLRGGPTRSVGLRCANPTYAMPEAWLACHLAEASRPAVQRPFPFARRTTAKTHPTTTRVRPTKVEAQPTAPRAQSITSAPQARASPARPSTSCAQAITQEVQPSSAGRVWPTPRSPREHEIRARPGRNRQGRPIRRTGAWVFEGLASRPATGPHTLRDRRPSPRTAHGTASGVVGTASGIGRDRRRGGREPLAERRGGRIRGREHGRDGACGALAVRGASVLLHARPAVLGPVCGEPASGQRGGRES